MAFEAGEHASTSLGAGATTLGAEAVAAAEHLGAPRCGWSGDDGPAIGAATRSLGQELRAIPR